MISCFLWYISYGLSFALVIAFCRILGMEARVIIDELTTFLGSHEVSSQTKSACGEIIEGFTKKWWRENTSILWRLKMHLWDQSWVHVMWWDYILYWEETILKSKPTIFSPTLFCGNTVRVANRMLKDFGEEGRKRYGKIKIRYVHILILYVEY